MNQWKFPGARWWKFDFHAHTPASEDFMLGCNSQTKAQVTPKYWLQQFMEKGIDCVAITDHNSGGWIDDLRLTLHTLEQEPPDWYRPLYLFPGVEISAQGGVHILAIFGHDKNKSDIDQLLGAVGYHGTRGRSDAVTTKSITDVVDEITRRDGIAIPAHVDKEKGLFQLQVLTQGSTLKQVLDNKNIYAMEVCDSNYSKPQLYSNKKVQWTEVRGSDTHNFRDDTFGTFTWVKMDEPSIEGLKLSLIDGSASVNPTMSDNPNRHAEFLIEELHIQDAKYIGRSKPLKCRFSPFLNTIIGGRGSGKSTLLEFMRFVLRRDEEIPQALQQESSKYFQVGDEDLLTKNSQISLLYRKGDVRYRLNWADKTDKPSLEEEKDSDWKSIPGEIKSLFPARIYSQKQIFELTKDPRALLNIIDEAPAVDYMTIDKKQKEFINRYKQIEQKLRELNEKIAQENRLRGEFNDLVRQIDQIERSGHKEVLQNYRKRQQQLNEIEHLENRWQKMGQRLAEMRADIAPARFQEQHFTEHPDMLSALKQTNEKWQEINNKLNALAQEAQEIIDTWKAAKDTAAWMQRLKEDWERYKQLHTQLAQQGIDPTQYPFLLQQQKSLQRELQQIGEYQARQKKLEAEKQDVFERIEENRKALSENRQKFLSCILQDNPSVKIEIKSFGQDWDGIEKEIRRVLQCGSIFIRDIDHLKEVYHSSGDQEIEQLKETIAKIRSGDERAKDARFARHLQSLPQESMSDLMLWFPGDDLNITFGPKNQPIEQGSPGQKTAALLAFILSYGSEPLLLDQPEDDLDNELIYELIVQQLRETKSKRQVIVVTHNANIVVNGDAEMVLPLKVAGGETHVQQAASIQNEQIRQSICDILEGGQQAFEQRYKRIHLES